MKILSIGASNNAQSINSTLAEYSGKLIDGASVESLNIADYELPIFSDEREKELGSPDLAKAFYDKISQADGLVISFAEHNGSYTAAYKNLFDWASRISKDVYQGKPTVFLSTSPGPGGAKSVLKLAVESADYFGAKLLASFSLPSFHENFHTESGELVNKPLLEQLQNTMMALGTEIGIADH